MPTISSLESQKARLRIGDDAIDRARAIAGWYDAIIARSESGKFFSSQLAAHARELENSVGMLLCAGKSKAVGLVCREIRAILNAMLKDEKQWQPLDQERSC